MVEARPSCARIAASIDAMSAVIVLRERWEGRNADNGLFHSERGREPLRKAKFSFVDFAASRLAVLRRKLAYTLSIATGGLTLTDFSETSAAFCNLFRSSFAFSKTRILRATAPGPVSLRNTYGI